MDDSIRDIQPNRPLDGNPPRSAPPGVADSTEFRRLLEQLEGLSRPASPTAGIDEGAADEDSPENLVRDLARADDDFRSVMDLRRRLEDAFRNLDS